MKIEIITEELVLNIHGFSGTAFNKDYSGTAFKLSGKMWEKVKTNDLRNKGINIWVYEPGERVFAGVELIEIPDKEIGLEQKIISLKKYGYCKHTGPYNLIKQAGTKMKDELERMGFETGLPYIEIYGHWTSDESKLETELLISLK